MKDSRAGSPIKGGNSADPIVMEGSNTQRRSEIVPELFKYDTAVRDEPDLLDEIQPNCSANVDIDDAYKPNYFEKKSPWQMRIKLKATALNADRY
ncbi:hypothetical protein AVEN_191170-1 [Araneus ventricosus]|uniref:Uncharacterized protein n=1 Tax=Araneus ventricosus TaxID=182803 RepID=A0A4Y2AXY6_ARAVE|nr:hypothetical protein AVEN_191170-1 [Araneus ventricosus]